MKVLFLTRRFYPEIGGVENHVLRISEILVKKNYEVTVISEKNNQSYRNTNQSNSSSAKSMGKSFGLVSVKIDGGKNDWFKKFRIWKELWLKRGLIKDADIVHCHDVFFWYLPFRFLYLRKKIFTTFHGYEGNTIPGKKAIFMHKLGEMLSNGNICVGEFLKKWYNTKPTFVTYGAVDLNKFRDNKNKNEAVFVGRLEEETGILKYLEALKMLKGKGMSLKLIVLGNGSLENRAKELARNNNLNVDFKGFVDDVEIYINASRLVFVSRYLGILEAMAAKKIVFAEYNNDIKKDYLRMTPFAENIIIAKTKEEIASQINNVLVNRKSEKQKIENAYEWVEKQTWENLTEIYLKLWK